MKKSKLIDFINQKIRGKFKIFLLILGLFLIFNISVAKAEEAGDRIHIPGIVEGTGKHFEITDSEYLNVSLDSTENISAKIESAPEMIVINIEASVEASNSDVIISGLSNNTTYHKYQDDYHNYVPLISDEKGKAYFVQDLSQSHIIFIQPRKSTKFIKDNATGGDCASIGEWDVSSKTCTLNQDVNETIQIDSDGIVLDGNGYLLSGKGTGTGVYAYNKKNLTVKNLTISGFYNGISFSASSSNNKITLNTLKQNTNGIYLQYSGRNFISNNNIAKNSNSGLNFYYATKNVISDNTIGPDNDYGIMQSWHNYYRSETNNIYENNDISNNGQKGIYIYGGNGDTLTNNNVFENISEGISIVESSNESLLGNIMSGNKEYNLYVSSGVMNSHNIDTSNKVEDKSVYFIKDTSNKEYAEVDDIGVLYCVNCEGVSFKKLSLSGKNAQIYFINTNNSSIENVISPDNNIEIDLNNSNNNVIAKNTFGFISLHYSNNNQIYNNNFMSAKTSAYIIFSEGNIFNLDLPVGGNYWKRNTSCRDNNGDNICDSAYKFSQNINIDNFPWAKEIDIYSQIPSGNSNVMFLPGIKASRLYMKEPDGDEDQLWEPNYFGDDINDLALNDNGQSVNDVYTKEVIDKVLPIVGPSIYESFIDKLESLKNDKTINDYDLFAYDWRKSVEDIAQNGTLYPDNVMKSAIATVEILSGSAENKKVTLIAHSNGGLLAKAIMQELERQEKTDKVDKIIFVGTPQMGTPMSILSLLYGYDEALVGGTLVSEAEARKFGENMPGAYGLLPSQKYFERMGEPFINFLSQNTRYKSFADAYGENVDSFEEFQEFVTGEGDGRTKPEKDDTDSENNLRRNILDQATEMHSRLDNWTPPSNIQVIEIAGWGLDTISGVDYTEKEKTKCLFFPGFLVPSCMGDGKYEPVYEPKFTVDGDKVVTAPSALMLPEGDNVKRYWVDLNKYNNDNPDVKHKNILESDFIQQFISSTLKNENASSLPDYIKTSRPDDYLNAKPRIRMSLYSPLDVHLYDEEGNHTGPKKVVDEKGNEGTIIEESIPNSYYFQFGDRKYVGVSSGENVHMVMDGYDEGSYTLKMEEVKETESGEETISHITFKNLPVSSDTNVTLDIPESGIDNLSELKTDYNGNGNIDYEVIPVTDGEAVMPDIFPSESKADLSGTRGNNDWYISDVSIGLNAMDNEGGSGVDKISYSINNGDWKDYSEPVIISQEGSNTLQYYSTDKKGNKEETKIETIKIDKTAPEAKVIFNQNNQEFDVVGVDNLSQNILVITEEKEVKEKSGKTGGVFSWIFDIIKKGKKNKIVIANLDDEAGNRTEIVLEKQENNDHFVNIVPRLISYNGEKTDFSKSLLQYKWLLNWRKSAYTLFGSHIRIDNKFLESHYFPKRNETWIMEKPRELDDKDDDREAEKRPVWKKLSGMIVPYIQTEKGIIKIQY